MRAARALDLPKDELTGLRPAGMERAEKVPVKMGTGAAQPRARSERISSGIVREVQLAPCRS